MNEYQAAVKQTIELMFNAARGRKGRVLDWQAVQHVCNYINNLIRIVEQTQVALMGADNMLAAYVEEYGDDLLNTLIADAQEVVEGEIVDDENEEDNGLDNEELRLDAQEEE